MNIGSIIEHIDSFSINRRSPGMNQMKGSTEEIVEPDIISEPVKSDILNVIDKLNSSLENVNEKVSFSYHEENKRIIIKVIDRETNEVVREIPPRDIVKLSEHIQEYLGMLVDESR